MSLPLNNLSETVSPSADTRFVYKCDSYHRIRLASALMYSACFHYLHHYCKNQAQNKNYHSGKYLLIFYMCKLKIYNICGSSTSIFTILCIGFSIADIEKLDWFWLELVTRSPLYLTIRLIYHFH